MPIARLLIPVAVLLLYLAWPYATLWRLDRALARDQPGALAPLVDLEAVRNEIRHRLNKDSASAIGPVSDDFVDWLEQAIRRNGSGAVDQQVTLEWLRERLLSQSPPGQGLTGSLSRAVFDDPLHFSLRLGAPSGSHVNVRLSFQGTGWRVTALSF
ncbi:MAG: DUF2939 domain-containing protein [Bdellovibrio bacteriovorus]